MHRRLLPDASGTSNVTTAASILTGMYNLNSDPFQIVLAGWTKENSNWVLHQYWSHNETRARPGSVTHGSQRW